MTAIATAKTLRVAPRKARLVVDNIRGLSVDHALANLKTTDKKAALMTEKVLLSAIANAENNFNMDVSKLYVKEAYVNEGVTLKRFKPRAQGSASGISKRTSHITVVVAENK